MDVIGSEVDVIGSEVDVTGFEVDVIGIILSGGYLATCPRRGRPIGRPPSPLWLRSPPGSAHRTGHRHLLGAQSNQRHKQNHDKSPVDGRRVERTYP
eukprot:2013588-Pyramimonas_sp.AAC.3